MPRTGTAWPSSPGSPYTGMATTPHLRLWRTGMRRTGASDRDPIWSGRKAMLQSRSTSPSEQTLDVLQAPDSGASVSGAEGTRTPDPHTASSLEADPAAQQSQPKSSGYLHSSGDSALAGVGASWREPEV